jgi:hypothetical protein
MRVRISNQDISIVTCLQKLDLFRQVEVSQETGCKSLTAWKNVGILAVRPFDFEIIWVETFGKLQKIMEIGVLLC